ncbi:MAG: alpha/beta hydrolase [Saprospiraceae bacterium]|uniref:Alpha/beta hydrolase n=1 Tax=Candidatus Opimibacter skivensis TaxID=2982028 RepID=A0A9D7XRI2_9BACT|nr:alpha/beta hydrolase [Candidatus Opimibacter skivensis]
MKCHSILLTLLFLISFLMPVCAQTSGVDTSKIGHSDLVGKYVSMRGFKMYYEAYGKGEPVLMIHGNGGDISNMLYQIPYFAQHYHVIVADSRDQGKSADPTDSISYEMMADDLNGLLEYLSIDSAYVIGWSDGGIEGLLLAMRHPDKVKKLAITGANLWPDSTAVDPWVVSSTAEYCQSLMKQPQTPELKHQIKLIKLCVFEPHITTKQLAQIKCPTLVIGGDHDVILPQHTMLIAQSIPKSYLWILPNSGHSTPIVYHDEFNRVIGEFFMKPYRKIEELGRFN